MAKYRKKPVVIDAWLFRRGEQESDLATYVMSGQMRYTDQDTILIKTLEGTMEARPGDWIIRGVKGELYPCKPDTFAANYDAVTYGSG